jgi:hypothetical protein
MPSVRRVQLYEDRNLPKCGWFHGCILCSTITSKIKLYDFKTDLKSKYEFYTFLCPPCHREIKNNDLVMHNYKMITNEMIFQEFGFK